LLSSFLPLRSLPGPFPRGPRAKRGFRSRSLVTQGTKPKLFDPIGVTYRLWSVCIQDSPTRYPISSGLVTSVNRILSCLDLLHSHWWKCHLTLPTEGFFFISLSAPGIEAGTTAHQIVKRWFHWDGNICLKSKGEIYNQIIACN